MNYFLNMKIRIIDVCLMHLTKKLVKRHKKDKNLNMKTSFKRLLTFFIIFRLFINKNICFLLQHNI